MRQNFTLFPADIQIQQDVLVDTVIIMLVVRIELYAQIASPVSGRRAKMLEVHLLSPGRCSGFQGPGLEVP